MSANALDTMALTSVLFVFRLEHMSRWTLVFFFLVSSFLLLSKRAAMRILLRRYPAYGLQPKACGAGGRRPHGRDLFEAGDG